MKCKNNKDGFCNAYQERCINIKDCAKKTIIKNNIMTQEEILETNIDELRDLLLASLIKNTDSVALKKSFNEMADNWKEGKIENFRKIAFFVGEEKVQKEIDTINNIAKSLKENYNSFLGMMLFNKTD